MPCNTVTTQSIALAKAIPSLLQEALKSLNWKVNSFTETQITAVHGPDSLTWVKGKGLAVKSQDSTILFEQIPQAYSKQVISWAAKRAGWQVTQTQENSFKVTSR